jgi:prefoldin subunit 5
VNTPETQMIRKALVKRWRWTEDVDDALSALDVLEAEVERLREERDRLTEALREVTNRLRLLTNDHAGVAIGESALAGVSE